MIKMAFNAISLDLREVLPTQITVEPIPYDLFQDTPIQIQTILRKLRRFKGNRIKSLVYAYYLGEILENVSQSRTSYRSMVTSEHYYQAAIRVYNIFEPYGLEQVYRTQNTTLTMVRRLTSSEYNHLRN